jgi:adenylate cyclase
MLTFSLADMERRLAVIFAADVVGYSRLMGADEEGTFAALKRVRSERLDPSIAENHGRIVKTTGDGILVEFPSVVDALRCAIGIQASMAEDAEASDERRLQLRIGINLGDVIIEEGDIYGDGVNLAARLEGEAEPGGIFVSQSVRELARGKLAVEFEDLGELALKNIARPIRIYRVVPGFRAVQSDPQSAKSIAVLPFANMSPDPENEYFADGITEEILMALSKVRDLHVISRTSVMEYKGTSKKVRQIASELGVGHVLEGSVRRAGNRVRITSQLVDARMDRHLWAESYERQLDDVFAIQSDVAQRIVDSLQATLTPAERARLQSRPTESVEAYEWYLKGRHVIARRDEAALRAAIDAFRKAVEADPNYAQAWSGLADGLALLPSFSATLVGEVLPEARRAAERAVSLDPGLGEAHASLGLVAFTEWSWSEAEREIANAIDLAPSYATTYHRLCLHLMAVGRYDEAIAAIERAQALDPAALQIQSALGAAFEAAGDLRRAEAIYREGAELYPDFLPYRVNLAELYEADGRIEEALAEHEALSRSHPTRRRPEFVSKMRAGYVAEGATGFWRAKVDELRVHGRTGHDALDLASALLRLGRQEEALDSLERMVAERWPHALQTTYLPQFIPLRSNPRYQALVQKIRAR